MKPSKVDDLLSKASEAIVSHDGRVQRKIHNYETVIGETPDDPLYIPDGAVNDNYGNVPNKIIIAGKPFLKITLLRYSMFATVAVVSLVFAWSLLSLVSPYKNSFEKKSLISESGSIDARTMQEQQLEKIANMIIRDGEWNDARLKIFLKEWNSSSPEDRNRYSDNAWFQHFNYRLKTKLEKDRYTGVINTYSSNDESHPLIDLALALNITVPNVNENPVATQGVKINAIAEEVSTELAKVEQEKKSSVAKQTSSNANQDDTRLNTVLMQNLGLLPNNDNELTPAKNAETIKQGNIEPVAYAMPGINGDDVKRVLDKYAYAYNQGDMDELTSLFGLKDPGEYAQMLAQLKSNFEFIFVNSSKRDVRFNGVNWRVQGNKAEVSSDYYADIQLNNNKGKQSVSADAKVEMELLDDKLQITRFALLNRNVNVVTPEIHLNSTSKSKTPLAPTAAELQDIVTKLVVAYETGDIKSLSSLFAENAKSNDRDNLKAIAKDYSELFATTNDRQMFIQNLHWSQDKNYAKGSGDLEAVVLSDSGQSVYTMKGKIQIIARRINDKVLITHLYHLEHSN